MDENKKNGYCPSNTLKVLIISATWLMVYVHGKLTKRDMKIKMSLLLTMIKVSQCKDFCSFSLTVMTYDLED